MKENNVHFLYPAGLFVSRSGQLISTVLGSCVAVCLWDRILKYGGMNHFMLPLWNGKGLASPKYGNIAIEKLYEKMIKMGCNKYNLKAKVFGGGDVISSDNNVFQIGKRNIIIAEEVLEELKIPVISSSTGGEKGRKILFNTATGEVIHRYVQKQSLEQLKKLLTTN